MKKLLTYLTVLALCVTVASAAFRDVPADAWYTEAVNKVTEKGIMAGTSDATFEPTGLVSRGAVVTVLWRMEHSPAPKNAAPYPDVEANTWYADAVAWASENAIAAGYGDGTFQGLQPVTREQLAMFLYRYAQLKNQEIAKGVLIGYSDADKISPCAQDSMKHAVGAGLITGSDGKLNPQGNAQRAELAVILMRFLTPAAG